VFRMTDLESGMAVDINIRDVTVDSFREQLNRGGKKPKNRTAFLRRLERRVEDAIEESLDPSLQPPKTYEKTEAVYRAIVQNISIPPEALRRRNAMLKFLRDNPRELALDDSQPASHSEHSPSNGEK